MGVRNTIMSDSIAKGESQETMNKRLMKETGSGIKKIPLKQSIKGAM